MFELNELVKFKGKTAKITKVVKTNNFITGDIYIINIPTKGKALVGCWEIQKMHKKDC